MAWTKTDIVTSHAGDVVYTDGTIHAKVRVTNIYHPDIYNAVFSASGSLCDDTGATIPMLGGGFIITPLHVATVSLDGVAAADIVDTIEAEKERVRLVECDRVAFLKARYGV